MMKKYTRGFTLIELLVVIAIIGILSSIVLVSLNTARGKGNDAKVQEQLSGLRAAAELYNTSNNGYGTFGQATCPTAAVASPTNFLVDAATGYPIIAGTTGTPGVGVSTCYANGTTWAVGYGLPSDATANVGYWCVDSSGKSEKVNNATAVTAGWTLTSCP